MTASNNKTLIIALGIIVLAAVAYLTLFNKPDTTPDLGFEVAAGSEAELFFVNLAGALEPIAFDATVLTDPRFTSLVDISTAIVPETAGRPDPFAPLPGTKAQN